MSKVEGREPMSDCSCDSKCGEAVAEEMKVLGGYVVVERDKAEGSEQMSPGGIVLPASAEKPPQTACVVGVGPDVDGINVGDKVVIGRFVGTDFEVGDKDLCAVVAGDIIAIV